ncbi:MAG: hypothetical protein U1F98_12240 [Verrucomicrobiota bacterium]
MLLFKLTADKTVKRLRWVMVGTMLFDKINTLLGQPSSYWQRPTTADEGDAFFYFFLSRGLPVYLLFSLVYIVVIFLLVSVLPRRLGLIIIFAFILCHFLGASTWLAYRWHFGVTGPIIYGIILSVLIVLLAFPDAEKGAAGKSR